jgi:predicted deacylase
MAGGREGVLRAPFEIGGRRVAPGTRVTVDLPVSRMSDHTPVTLSVHVVHGREPGPVMFVSAAMHGDEVAGIEIVRRLLRAPALDRLAGTLMAVPIVNTFGFLNQSRYLPDRRDLNRSFPGSAGGSLAARLAHLFLTEVVRRAQVGVDLHTAASARTNLPQVRVSPTNLRLLPLADTFGAPVVLVTRLREGSLRMAAEAMGVDVLLYEGGEGLRFDEPSVTAGVAGCLRVMQALGMVGSRAVPRARARPVRSTRSVWERAPAGGLMRAFRATGEAVAAGDLLAVVSDPFGEVEAEVRASVTGLIVGGSVLPVVNEGDALFHIAEIRDPAAAEAAVRAAETQALPDEDEII